MTYDLNTGLYLEDGPAVLAASAAARRSNARLMHWRKLDADRRLATVERALKSPANDDFDAFPVAL